MGKGFTAREKEIIRKKLIKHGKELFSFYGLKKTTITELCKAAGIAQGSFYNFFNSKEDLYLEILESEERASQEKFFRDYFSSGKMTKELFKGFLNDLIFTLENNALLNRLFIGDEYDVLQRKLPENEEDNNLSADSDVLVPLVRNWQKEDLLIEGDPEVIAGLIRAYILIILHKKEIGEEVYDDVKVLFVNIIADSLCTG